ncbi:hypothetical protein GEMRC1_007692 [Eukaryota sp. GEM-RC1]
MSSWNPIPIFPSSFCCLFIARILDPFRRHHPALLQYLFSNQERGSFLSHRGFLLETLLSVIPWAIRLFYSSRSQEHLKDNLSTIISLFQSPSSDSSLSSLYDFISSQVSANGPFIKQESNLSLVHLLSSSLTPLFENFDQEDSVPELLHFIYTLEPQTKDSVPPSSLATQPFSTILVPVTPKVFTPVSCSFYFSKEESYQSLPIIITSILIEESSWAWREQPGKFVSIIKDQGVTSPSLEPKEYHHAIIQHCFSTLLSRRHPRSLHYLHYFFMLSGLSRSVQRFAASLGPIMAHFVFSAHLLSSHCFNTFSDWFSQHLSNFAWTFPWHCFAPLLDEPPCSPGKILIGNIMDKCVQLSYRGRLSKELPTEWKFVLPMYVPPFSDCGKEPVSEGFSNPIGAESHEHHGLYVTVFNKLIERDDPTVWVELTGDVTADMRVAISLYAVVTAGIPSISFAAMYTTVYLTALKEKMDLEPFESLIIAIVIDFWKVVPQRCIITLNHLLKLEIISIKSILSYLLPSEPHSDSSELFSTIKRHALLFPSTIHSTTLYCELWQGILSMLELVRDVDAVDGPLDYIAVAVKSTVSICDDVMKDADGEGEFHDEARKCKEAGSLSFWRDFTMHMFADLLDRYGGDRVDVLRSLCGFEKELEQLVV